MPTKWGRIVSWGKTGPKFVQAYLESGEKVELPLSLRDYMIATYSPNKALVFVERRGRLFRFVQWVGSAEEAVEAVAAGILSSEEVPGSVIAAGRLLQGDSAEATQYPASDSRFGPNAGQVQWLLDRLASLDAMTWASVAAEHQVAGRTGPALSAKFARENAELRKAAAEATHEAGVLALSAAGPEAAAAWRAEGLEAGRRSRGLPCSVAADAAAEAERWKQAEFAWWLLSAAEWATAIMASRPAMDDRQFTALWAPYEIWLGSPPDS